MSATVDALLSRLFIRPKANTCQHPKTNLFRRHHPRHHQHPHEVSTPTPTKALPLTKPLPSTQNRLSPSPTRSSHKRACFRSRQEAKKERSRPAMLSDLTRGCGTAPSPCISPSQPALIGSRRAAARQSHGAPASSPRKRVHLHEACSLTTEQPNKSNNRQRYQFSPDGSQRRDGLQTTTKDRCRFDSG